jgi:YegS/Rv2252/BmrU family lipid kinase
MDQRLTILSNPAAGGRRSSAILEHLRSEHPSSKVITNDDPAGVRELVRDLDLEPKDTLLVLGGDGTIHQAVSGLFEASPDTLPALAILPCGSGNALAAALGVKSKLIAEETLRSGRLLPIDVAKVTTDSGTSHAINVVGWGLPARVTLLAEKMRSSRGLPYTRAALRVLLFGDIAAVNTHYDSSVEARDLMGLACLTPEAGGGMPIAPDALLDDGEFDLVRVKPTSRLQLLLLFARLTQGWHLSARAVEHRRAQRLQIQFDEPRDIVVDGEMQITRALSIEVLPSALRVLTPR